MKNNYKNVTEPKDIVDKQIQENICCDVCCSCCESLDSCEPILSCMDCSC